MTTDAKQEFSIFPVGVVESPLTAKDLKPAGKFKPSEIKQEKIAYKKKIMETPAIIRVFPEHGERLQGIDGFSHLQVVFWPHMIDPQKRKTLEKVHPRGMKEIDLQGIFATRSPVRPNPLLITIVRLEKREGLSLYVKGLDCINDTPVLDIKPVISQQEPSDDFRVPEWVQLIRTKTS